MEEHQLTLADYVAILKRRAWLIAGSFAVTLAIGVAVSLLLPPTYRSTGTIMIESQQIPVEFVQASVTSYADERIEVTKQRVMTRENLLNIIRKYALFADAGATFTPSDQIEEMRRSVMVDVVNANVRSDRGGAATIAFSVSFDHRRAAIAQAVASDLVTLFLDENAKVRTQRASQTTEFLSQESEKLKKELGAIEGQISRYKQEHASALPENVALGMATMQRVEADLRQVERDLASAEDDLRGIEAERAMVGMVGTDPGPKLSELQVAQAELARLAGMYTENHPDLKAARRRVAALEQTPAAAPAGSKRVTSAADAALIRLDARSAGVRERIRVLSAQRTYLRGRLGQMDVSLVKSPQVEQALTALTRDYQSAQKKYEEILAKKMTAQVAERLEGDQKAERFAVLEPPTLPDKPMKPDRKKLLALSLVLALAAPFGGVVLMESVHGVVRGVGPITAILGQKPLVTIPFITVAAERAHRRKLVLALAGGSALLIVLLLVVTHFLILPLDLLIMKALFRVG